jgi:nickel/cobalt exporter
MLRRYSGARLRNGQGMWLIGVAAVLTMAAGTAVTVTAIAILAVAARRVAAQFVRARDGAGVMVLRGVEVAAAVLVLGFGVLLLLGFMATERLMAM